MYLNFHFNGLHPIYQSYFLITNIMGYNNRFSFFTLVYIIINSKNENMVYNISDTLLIF